MLERNFFQLNIFNKMYEGLICLEIFFSTKLKMIDYKVCDLFIKITQPSGILRLNFQKLVLLLVLPIKKIF